MANGNGWKQGFFVVLAIIVTATLYIGGPMLVNNVIANDKETRKRESELELRIMTKIECNQQRIESLQRETQGKLDIINTQSTAILIAIAELKKDVNR